MPTANDLLVNSLTISQKMLNRYTQDLTPQEYLHRPCAGGNTAAWIIGHLVLTDRVAMARAGLKPGQMPALPEGFEKRFSREPDAPKASEFGDVRILMPLFNEHRQLLIDTVRRMSPAELDTPLEKPHPMFGAVIAEALNFVGGPHAAMHAGQITIIRRSMGKPPLT